MAMPKNKAVEVVRIAADPKMATDQINDAIKAIEDAEGTDVTVEALYSDTVILTYAPAGAEAKEGGSDIDDNGGDDNGDDNADDNGGEG
jgi:hypothetical protein